MVLSTTAEKERQQLFRAYLHLLVLLVRVGGPRAEVRLRCGVEHVEDAGGCPLSGVVQGTPVAGEAELPDHRISTSTEDPDGVLGEGLIRQHAADPEVRSRPDGARRGTALLADAHLAEGPEDEGLV